MTKSLGLIEFCAGALYHFRPFGRVGLDRRSKVLRCPAGRLVADPGKLLLESLGRERFVDCNVQLLYDRPRHASWRDHTGPGGRQMARYAGFGDRRQVRKYWRARASADAESACLIVAREGRDGLQVLENKIEMTSNQIGDGRRAATIRDVHDFSPGHVFE